MKKYKLHAAIVSYVGDQQIILVSTKIKEKKDVRDQLNAKSDKLQGMLNKYLMSNLLSYMDVDKTTIEPVYVYDVSKITIPLDNIQSYAKGAKIYTLQSGKALFVYEDTNTTAPTNMKEVSDTTTETIMLTAGLGVYTVVDHWKNKYNKEANIMERFEVTYPKSEASIDISHLKTAHNRI